ncbi:hypothetical protein ACLOJK_033318 [Asimina triloba]
MEGIFYSFIDKKKIHKLVNGTKLVRNIHVVIALIDMHLNFSVIGLAPEVFDEMPKRDVVAWTAMISSSTFDTEQLAQLCKHEREGLIEDLLDNFSPHLESSALSSKALAPQTPIPTGLEPSKLITQAEFFTLLEGIKSLQ